MQKQTRALVLLLCAIVVPSALSNSRAFAAEKLVLDRAASDVRVEIPTPQGIIIGKLTDFSGEGEFPTDALEKGRVSLIVNPSRITVVKAPSLPFIRVENLLQLIPKSPMSFKSTGIRKDTGKNGSYQVAGDCNWQAKTQKVSIPFSVVERSSSRTVVEIERSGIVPELGLIMGVLAQGQPFTPEGHAKARLVFRPSKRTT